MRKFTLLSVLFLLTGWINAWAQTLVNDVAQLTDGTVVALQCRDTNGGPNWYFNGKAVKSETLSYANLFKVRTLDAGGFALQRMSDGTYVGKEGDQQTVKATKAEAAPFTATIATATGWTTVVEGTENGVYTVRFTTDGSHLNTQAQSGVPKYAAGTGGYSVWYVYTFTSEEAKAMQPYYRFESPRGGFLNANGESGNLQHINEKGNTSWWTIELNEDGDGVKLYNASQTLPLASQNGFTAEGATWYVLDNPHRAGYKCISKSSTLANNCLDANNNNSGVGTWQPSASDNEGTSWAISVYSPADDLRAAIEALSAAIGTDPGYIAATEDINSKIAAAEAALNNPASSAEQLNEQKSILEETLAGTTRIMPEAGKFYQIINAFPGFETGSQGVKKAMYSDGAHLRWGTLNDLDRTQIWTIVPAEGGYTIQNYGDQKYPAGVSAANTAFTVGTETTVSTIDFLTTGQFNVKISSYPAHAGGHSNGAGVSGDIFNWGGGANTCSAWYLHEVSEPQGEVFKNVTFNYTVNGEVKKSVVGNFDTANPVVPATFAFVTLGDITFNRESNTATVPCTVNLPFTASTDYASATWYTMDMHCNDTGTPEVNNGTNRYIWTFVAEDADVELPKVLSTEVDNNVTPDNRKWAFVGNPFDGFKIYNKAAGAGLTLRKAENGNTPAVMSATDDRNVFFLHNTTAGIENSFAWKLADDNYFVNTQKAGDVKVLRGWTSADGGSSCRVFVPNDIQSMAFYRIKGVANELYLSTGATGSRMPMIADGTGAASIFYFDANKRLLNYNSGLYAYNTSETGAIGNANTWQVTLSGENTYVFYASATGRNGRYLYNHNAGDQTQANRNSAPAGNNTLWTIEAVTELPVTITAAGYSTLYAPVALTLPAEVKAYSGAIEGDKLILTEIEGTIPANTAVVLAANAGTYNLAISSEAGAEVSENALTGVVATAAAPANAYTLQNQNDVVGFYPYTGTNVNGFKAYLTNAAGVKGFAFDFGTATGLDQVTAEGEQKEVVIYDLTGRRVQKAVKGLYIINGKKVIVK